MSQSFAANLHHISDAIEAASDRANEVKRTMAIFEAACITLHENGVDVDKAYKAVIASYEGRTGFAAQGAGPKVFEEMQTGVIPQETGGYVPERPKIEGSFRNDAVFDMLKVH
jgi:hypothetical protein